MTKKYFKCTLLSDIVINASLATEGNMKTLDYIPGSNFLGIVAKNYEAYRNKGWAYDIFHSGNVSFGDAHISADGTQSYAMPFSLFTDKLKKEVTGEKAEVWVHHFLENNNIRPEDDKGNSIQLKQHRAGYFNPNKKYIPKVEKRFALKSAQDRGTRKSKDTAMFGFESMKEGQEFIFSVDFKNDDYIEEVISALKGVQRVGKSKTAQYGQVEITALENTPTAFGDGSVNGNQLIIYAESNLCFFNKYGQATFQPVPKDFGLEGKGEINWAASQIRTYSYSPWNFFRGTTDTQRDCVLKGSVIVFEFDENQKPHIPVNQKTGAFQAEGLGRILYNPDFLNADKDTGLWPFKLEEAKGKPKKAKVNVGKEDEDFVSPLAKFLNKRRNDIEDELKIGTAVQRFLNGKTKNGKAYKIFFKDITTSQWGGIRNFAVQAEDMYGLKIMLFGKKRKKKKDNHGFLVSSTSADEYWHKGKRGDELLRVLFNNRRLNPIFMAKLAAEMAKLKQQSKDN